MTTSPFKLLDPFNVFKYRVNEAGGNFERWILPIVDYQMDDMDRDMAEVQFDNYATYLFEEKEWNSDKVVTEIYLVCEYYKCLFSDWYEMRSLENIICPAYEEWKQKEHWALLAGEYETWFEEKWEVPVSSFPVLEEELDDYAEWLVAKEYDDVLERMKAITHWFGSWTYEEWYQRRTID